MFEGKDRAMRERIRLDKEFKQSMEIDSIQISTDKDTKVLMKIPMRKMINLVLLIIVIYIIYPTVLYEKEKLRTIST